MKVDVPIDPNDIREKHADERGRVTLGAEYANKKVLVTVLESEDAVDYEAAGDAADELVELFESVEDFDEMYRLLQDGEMEEAYAMMGLSTDEAESKAVEWRNEILSGGE